MDDAHKARKEELEAKKAESGLDENETTELNNIVELDKQTSGQNQSVSTKEKKADDK